MRLRLDILCSLLGILLKVSARVVTIDSGLSTIQYLFDIDESKRVQFQLIGERNRCTICLDTIIIILRRMLLLALCQSSSTPTVRQKLPTAVASTGDSWKKSERRGRS